MKISLPTDKIKEFINLSSFVETDRSDIIPVLRYLWVEVVMGTCIITKINSKSFVRYSFSTDQDDIEFLIDDKILKLIGSISTAKSIEFEVHDDLVKIRDGYNNQECSSGEYRAGSLPALPIMPSSFIRMDKPILDSLNCARANVGKDELQPMFSSVFMDGDTVFASTGHVFYLKKIKSPKIAISPRECELVFSFPFIEYGESDNFNIYRFNNVTYGFRKPEGANPWPHETIWKNIKKQNYCSIRKDDWVNFCNTTRLFASKKDFCNSTMVVEQNKAIMIYEEKGIKGKNILEVPVSLDGSPFSFHFSPGQVLDILSPLPFMNICIGDEGSAISLFSPNDPDYLGVVAKQNL